MTDLLLRDVPAALHDAILRRAEISGKTPEHEAQDILQDALFQDELKRIVAEKGLGSALYAIGREFRITDEFDNLRSQEAPRAASFE